MRKQHQTGYIWRENGAWYGRWREDVLQENGTVKRIQKARKLADVSDRYRTESDVRPLLDEILQPLNTRKVDVRSTMTLAQYVDDHYLPYLESELKPSTRNGYKNDWKRLVKPHIGQITLRDFTTRDGHDLLLKLRAKGLGRRSLYHVKTLLSAIFSHAINLGVLNGGNPITEVKLPRTAAPAPTHGYTAQEIQDMLTLFDQRAREGKTPLRVAVRAKAAIGLMFFAGLRPGEARGVTWGDYDDKKRLLTVSHSVWRTNLTDPKTPESAKPVPVIEPLRDILAELRAVDGNPASGPILRNLRFKKVRPLNLDLFARRVVAPALLEAKKPWYGWYACRRGIGTILATVTRDPNASKGLLRHSSLSTTLQHYVLDVPEVTMHGMAQVEQLFAPVCAPTEAQEQAQETNCAVVVQEAHQERTPAQAQPQRPQ